MHKHVLVLRDSCTVRDGGNALDYCSGATTRHVTDPRDIAFRVSDFLTENVELIERNDQHPDCCRPLSNEEKWIVFGIENVNSWFVFQEHHFAAIYIIQRGVISE